MKNISSFKLFESIEEYGIKFSENSKKVITEHGYTIEEFIKIITKISNKPYPEVSKILNNIEKFKGLTDFTELGYDDMRKIDSFYLRIKDVEDTEEELQDYFLELTDKGNDTVQIKTYGSSTRWLCILLNYTNILELSKKMEEVDKIMKRWNIKQDAIEIIPSENGSTRAFSGENAQIQICYRIEIIKK